MGFFSGLMGGQKTSVPASGFYSLPKNAQGAYNTYVNNAQTLAGDTSLFQPAAFTQDQNTAFGMARNAAAPTEESIQGLIAPYMNPYMNSVISEVNRQAQGENSVLQQNMNAAGQVGSNRQLLDANDIDLSRMNTIGSLLGGQYNTALNTGLSQQQTGINNLLQTGGMQQTQNQGMQQAPLAATEWLQSIMSGYPSGAFLNSAPASTVKTGGGIGGLLNTASSVASIASMFSDENLKDNIELIGTENGHNVYKFNYKSDRDNPNKKTYIGVMAQDVLQTNPEAVTEIDGFYAVNYDKIGVKFREA